MALSEVYLEAIPTIILCNMILTFAHLSQTQGNKTQNEEEVDEKIQFVPKNCKVIFNLGDNQYCVLQPQEAETNLGPEGDSDDCPL